jgi:hypothetical protein
MAPTKRAVLSTLTIGSRVAEEETERLASYFVETDQWRKVVAGEVDIIFGPKGAGKSAIYTYLLGQADDFFDRGVLFVSGENPRGAPAFKDLVSDPPTSEREFVGLWKLYVLSLLVSVFDDFGIDDGPVRELRSALTNAGLYTPGSVPLRTRVRAALDYVRKAIRLESLEGGFTVDPATGAPAVTGKITLREPTTPESKSGYISVDSLLDAADGAFDRANLRVWVLFDRLDVAFAESRELEANALRALFKVYLDTLKFSSVDLKIFLRSDIWRAITEEQFREASHLTRKLDIDWNGSSLLNLLVRRLLQNPDLCVFYGVDAEEVLADADKQRAFFERLVPEQIDSGRNPKTFEWMLGRVQDGTKKVAPRELIHLASRTRDVQLAMLERGEPEPADKMLFSRQAFRDALPEVSTVRLEQTLFAEYPDLKAHLLALEEQKTNHDVHSLAAIWETSEDVALKLATELVDVGFFERRGTKENPIFWIPFLYRPALRSVQGTAE